MLLQISHLTGQFLLSVLRQGPAKIKDFPCLWGKQAPDGF